MELLYKELTERVIKALYEVFSNLGPGLNEVIYKRALKDELGRGKVKFKAEIEIPVFYKKKQLGSQRIDLVIDEKVILELKSKSALEPLDEAQIITYLKSSGYRIGILVNFGSKKLEFKRFIV